MAQLRAGTIRLLLHIEQSVYQNENQRWSEV